MKDSVNMSLNIVNKTACQENQYEKIYAVPPNIVIDTASSNEQLDTKCPTFALQESRLLEIISTPSFDDSNIDEIEIIVIASDERDTSEPTTIKVCEKDAFAAENVRKKKTGFFSKIKGSMRKIKKDPPTSKNFSAMVSRQSIVTDNTADDTDEESTTSGSDDKQDWLASSSEAVKTSIAKVESVKNVTPLITNHQNRMEKAAKIHAETVASMKMARQKRTEKVAKIHDETVAFMKTTRQKRTEVAAKMKRTELATKIQGESMASMKTAHQKRMEVASKIRAAQLAKALEMKDESRKNLSLNTSGLDLSHQFGGKCNTNDNEKNIVVKFGFIGKKTSTIEPSGEFV